MHLNLPLGFQGLRQTSDKTPMAEKEPVDDPDDKELVSLSPDSGISSYDGEEETREKTTPRPQKQLSEEKVQPAPSASSCPNTLNPFFYRYHDSDNRKLTLLKSLSQDSEYSLDGSLFDAEEFLQDLGFAGHVDPTIPERFLPSLIQRLSKFPESEMRSLNERIVQSIGCFRRKEGKRRLFRNLSMGKDSLHERSIGNCLFPTVNSYPLLRSNTDPAAFPSEDVPAKIPLVGEDSADLVSERAKDSPEASSVSQGEDSFMPQSPVAILVSQASVDFPDSDNGQRFENGETSANCDSSERSNLRFHVPIPDYDSIECYDSDDMFSDTDTIREKENVSPNRNADKQLSNDSLSSIAITENPSIFVTDQNLHSAMNGEFDSERLVLYNRNSLPDINTPSPEGNKSLRSVTKTPLRRASTPQSAEDIDRISNSLRNSSATIPLMLQNKENPPVFYIGESPANDNSETVSGGSSTNVKNSNLHLSTENIGNSIPDIPSQHPPFLNKSTKSLSEINLENKESSPNKTYSRSYSFSNFLTSMLNTEDEFRNNTPSPLPNDSAISVIPHNPSSMVSEAKSPKQLEEVNKKCISEEPIITESQPQVSHDASSQILDNSTESNDRAQSIINRKRRLLRRMSSSLQCPYSVDLDDSKIISESHVHTHSIESFDCLTPVFTKPQKRPVTKMMSDSFSIPQTDRNALYRVKSCNCASFDVPKNIYDEMRQVNNDDFNFSNNKPNAFISKNTKRTKRKRNLTCPITNYKFNFSPKIHFNRTSFFNSVHSSSCSSLPPHCSQQYKTAENSLTSSDFNQATKALTGLQNPPGKIKHSPTIQKSIINREQIEHHRKSPPLPTVPLRTNDFFPSRARLEKSENCICHLPESIPFQERIYQNKFIPNDSSPHSESPSTIELNTPFRKRLHRFERFSDAHSTLFDSSLSQDDDVFSPKPTVYSCSKCRSCPCTLENKRTENRKLHFQFPSETHPNIAAIKSHHYSRNQNDASTPLSVESHMLPKSAFKFVKRDTTPSIRTSQESRWNLLRVSKSLPPRMNDPKDSPPFQGREKIEMLSSNARRKSTIAQNKREAMLEKKIHLFSKFVTNLSNLSANDLIGISPASSPDKKSNDAFGISYASDKSKQSIECITPPPETDKSRHVSKADINQLSLTSTPNVESSSHRTKLPELPRSPVYKNELVLKVNCSDEFNSLPVYSSSVLMSVNVERNEDSGFVRTGNMLSSPETGQEEKPSCKTSVPFKGVSKDLEELQVSIQKAKETRISASRELHFLQELLSGDASDELQKLKSSHEKGSGPARKTRMRRSFSSDVLYGGKARVNHPAVESKALSDLRQKSKHEVFEDADYLNADLEKSRKENDQKWQERLKRLEKQLRSQEEELIRAHSENEELHRRLEEQSSQGPAHSDSVQNGFLRIDSAFEDDEEFLNHKPSTPPLSMKQEMERLQDALTKSEQRADELNLLLNQKLIELNKLQISFSKQTKEMIELEKSYIQLQCRFRRSASKPVVSRLCSRTSPFASKNLFPKPSPPASPLPSSICP